MQFPEKISANDSPMNALIPMRINDCGACSREEPHPKFLPTTRRAPPLKRGSLRGCFRSLLSLAGQGFSAPFSSNLSS